MAGIYKNTFCAFIKVGATFIKFHPVKDILPFKLFIGMTYSTHN